MQYILGSYLSGRIHRIWRINGVLCSMAVEVGAYLAEIIGELQHISVM